MSTINVPRAFLAQVLAALEIGYDSAKAEADAFHAAMAGYKPLRHAAMDADVQEIARAITALRAALAQQEQQADYPEEKLQAVAEYVSNQYHVWYGVNARDVEEVLRQSVSCGLVSNPPRREWQGLSEEEINALWASHDKTGEQITRAIEQVLRSKNNG